MVEIKKVVIPNKVDFDVLGCAFMKEIDPTEVEVEVADEASSNDLLDPSALCIEVGGSGLINLNNFDHHGENAPNLSATTQAFYLLQIPSQFLGYPIGHLFPFLIEFNDYVDGSDRKGKSKPNFSENIAIMALFGLLSSEKDSKKQFVEGVRILNQAAILGLLNWYPYARKSREYKDTEEEQKATVDRIRFHSLCFPNWDGYISVFLDEARRWGKKRRLLRATKEAKWSKTKSSLKLAYSRCKTMGIVGYLYNLGAEVVVVLNPNFREQNIRKFTIASNDIQVNKLLPMLNELEPGWAGPASRIIIGSSKQGSKLKMGEVVKIVKENL